MYEAENCVEEDQEEEEDDDDEEDGEEEESEKDVDEEPPDKVLDQNSLKVIFIFLNIINSN